MKEWAESFYNSMAWKECRTAYRKKRGGLCERCLKKGVFSAGEIVHHKIKLTPQNVTDPTVTLNTDNLELLCRECHAEVHEQKRTGWRKNWRKPRRYSIGEDGRVTT